MPGVNPTKTTMENNKQNTESVVSSSSDNRCNISDLRDVRQIIAENRAVVNSVGRVKYRESEFKGTIYSRPFFFFEFHVRTLTLIREINENNKQEHDNDRVFEKSSKLKKYVRIL